MRTDKFFKWVWNINGLMVLLGIVIITVSAIYSISGSIYNDDYYPQDPQTLNLAEDAKDKEKWSLGSAVDIPGSHYYYIALESENREVAKAKTKGYGSYSSGYEPTRAKNVIFIDSNSNDSHWLFKTVEQLIINMSAIYIDDAQNRSVGKAVYYEVINNDSNKDKVFDYDDKRSFALTKTDGTGYKEIISGYNQIVNTSVNGNGDLFVIYINNDEVHSMIISLDDFTVKSKKQLPKVSEAD